MWSPAVFLFGAAERVVYKTLFKMFRPVFDTGLNVTKFWQGWKESNLRMPESKSGALTNLATPLHGTDAGHLTDQQPTHNHLSATNLPEDGLANYCICGL